MEQQPGDGDLDGAVPADSLPDGAVAQLGFRYGNATRNVLALVAEEPELAGPIVEGHPDLLAEAVLAARHEQARSVGDVLLRRTRLALVGAPSLRTAESVRPLAALLGRELGWDEARVLKECDAWLEELAAEGCDVAALG